MSSVRFQGQIVFPKVFTQENNPFSKKIFTPPQDWKLEDWKARPDEFYFVDLSKTDEKGNKVDDVATDLAAVSQFIKPDMQVPFAFKPSSDKGFMHAADNPFSEESKAYESVVKGNPFNYLPQHHERPEQPTQTGNTSNN